MIFAELKTSPTGIFQIIGDGELKNNEGQIFLFDGDNLCFTGDGSRLSLKEASSVVSDFSQIKQICP